MHIVWGDADAGSNPVCQTMNEHLFPYINMRLDEMLTNDVEHEVYPSTDIIEYARSIAVEYIPDNAPTPNVLPDEEWTGVSFTWHKAGYDISFDICKDHSLFLWWRNRITLETDCIVFEKIIKEDIVWLMDKILK